METRCLSSSLLFFVVLTNASPARCLPSLVPVHEASNRTLGPTTSLDDRWNDHAVVQTQGWTAQPNGRGTVDIIWSCAVTIFLCSWSVLCLNLPAVDDKWYDLLWRKFSLATLGILGPEFILQSALGQWISARRALMCFHRDGYLGWTMTHAFFADMGGFVLHPCDWVPFPIDAKQLHYLIHNKYLECPQITKKEIEDRNKADTLLRVITILQTLWFVLNCLARRVQGLDITTFELTTIGFIFCTLGTHLCWWHKPADVEVPIVLYCKTSIRDILLDAGDQAREPYSRTPLDFISRKEWSWSLWWSFAMNATRKVLNVRFQPRVRPITRIPNDLWLDLPSAAVFALGFVDMAYASIYLSGWNFWFATELERVLWRTSTTAILLVIVCYLVVELYTFYLVPAMPLHMQRILSNDSRLRSKTWLSNERCEKLHHKLESIRNNSPNKDSQLYMPLKASIPITVTGIIYGLARAYLLFECIFALRRLPTSAYQTVNWSGMLPHV